MSKKPRTTLPAFTPVPRERERHNGWKPEVQRAFIEALAETGSVRAACRRVGRADHGAYLLRRHPEAGEFRKAWDAALDIGVRRIEDAAMDRALYGTEEVRHYHGGVIGTHRRYNERLVMFILRNRAPHRFADGGAKGLNAVGKMDMKRLKKQWRKEWEAERWALDREEEQETLASIDAFLDNMRSNRMNNMSPRARAAYAEAERIAKEDGTAWMDEEIAAGEDDGEVRIPLPAPREEQPAEEEVEPGPKVRTLKDEGW